MSGPQHPSPDRDSPGSDTTRHHAVSSSRAALTTAAVVLAVVSADQVSKNLAVNALVDGPAEGPGPFWFRLVANRGALIGLPLPGWLLVGAVFAVLIMAVRSILQPGTYPDSVAWGLVMGGAFGNLADRFLHRPQFPDHAVVDWIASSVLPTFNLADVAIVAGMLTLVATPIHSNRVVAVVQ